MPRTTTRRTSALTRSSSRPWRRRSGRSSSSDSGARSGCSPRGATQKILLGVGRITATASWKSTKARGPSLTDLQQLMRQQGPVSDQAPVLGPSDLDEQVGGWHTSLQRLGKSTLRYRQRRWTATWSSPCEL